VGDADSEHRHERPGRGRPDGSPGDEGSPAAGHFAHPDDPLQYASAVSDFVGVAAGDLTGTGTGQVPATGS
jgi:hypothetical protein